MRIIVPAHLARTINESAKHDDRIQVMSSRPCKGSSLIRVAKSMLRTIQELKANRAIILPRDYCLVMMVANQELEKFGLFFYTPKDFLDYLKGIGLDGLPGRSTIYDMIAITVGKYPEWTFTDKPGCSEELRRNNVGRQFLSAFNRAYISFSDAFSDAFPDDSENKFPHHLATA